MSLSQKADTWDIKSSHANYSPSGASNGILKEKIHCPFVQEGVASKTAIQNSSPRHKHTPKAANTARDTQESEVLHFLTRGGH